MQTEHLIVVSHRRSGTHLAIDALLNNMPAYQRADGISFLNLDTLVTPEHAPGTSVAHARAILEAGPCIIKTHAHADVERFFDRGDAGSEASKLAVALFGAATVLNVHRDGRDVMTSLFHYVRSFGESTQDMPLGEFLRMPNGFDAVTYDGDMVRPAYWASHVSSWLHVGGGWNPRILSFDDVRWDYRRTLSRISALTGVPLGAGIVDIRHHPKGRLVRVRSRLMRWLGVKKKRSKMRRTSVAFRRGSGGEWRRLFGDADLEFFEDHAGAVNRELGYVD